jgi:Cell Wall Hydrolase
MTITLRRQKKSVAINPVIRLIAALCALLAVSSCVSDTARFGLIPGVRGPSLSIPLDPPIPSIMQLTNAQPTTLSEAQLTGQVPGMPEGMTYETLATMQSGGAPVDPAAPVTVPATTTLPGLPALPPSNLILPVNPGPAAKPALFRATSVDNLRASICLTTAIYYEAASESDDGQRAVAQVILNRVHHPAYPKTVCGVVFQGTDRGDRLCQFSFACDGAMLRAPSREGWSRARRIAVEALAGNVYTPVGLSTHYHTHAVSPAWDRNMIKAAVIGAHAFFRLPGTAGTPGVFYANYRGREPFPAPLGPPVLRTAPTPSPVNIAMIGPVAPPSVAPGTAPTLYQPAPQPVARTPIANIQPHYRSSGDVLPGGAADRAEASSDSQILPQYRNSGQWLGR